MCLFYFLQKSNKMLSLFKRDFTSFLFSEKEEKSKLQALYLFLYLCVFYWFKITYHEIWKDEWQAWFVARDMSWSEMLGFLYYEGHPSLWYIFLKITTSIKSVLLPFLSDEIVFQSSHFLLFALLAYFISFKMKFSWLGKILLLSSFFVGFEYGMINRGYILVLLFSFYAVYLATQTEVKSLSLSIVIFLLCQTEVQGVIIASSILFYLFLKKIQATSIKKTLQTLNYQLYIFSFVLGAITFVATIFPRGNQEDLNRAYNSAKQPLNESIMMAFQGLLANTFLIGSTADTNVSGISSIGILLSILVLAGLIYFFYSDKKLLYTFLYSFAIFYAFAAFIFVGGVRQWGNFFILFALLLYLFQHEKNILTGAKLLIISVIFLFQMYYNALALYKDAVYPFSNAKQTAAFLVAQNIPKQVPIVAINEFETGVLNGYLDRKLYSLPKGETFTYFKWLSKVYLPSETELQLFAQFKKVKGLVVVSGVELPTQRYPNLSLKQKYNDYNIKGEIFYVYTFQVK